MPASSASASSEERLRKFLTPGAVSTLVDVGEKIGAGGFSVVRQGKLKSNGEAVAVKVILPSQYATTAQRLAALQRLLFDVFHESAEQFREYCLQVLLFCGFCLCFCVCTGGPAQWFTPRPCPPNRTTAAPALSS